MYTQHVEDLRIEQGDNYTLTVTFADSDGSPLDVHTSTFTPTVAAANSGVTAQLNFTVDMTSAATGTVVLTLAGSDLAAVRGPAAEPVWFLLWDLFEAGRWNKTLFRGRIALEVQV